MNMNTIEQALNEKMKHMGRSDFEKFMQKLNKMYNKLHNITEEEQEDENR